MALSGFNSSSVLSVLTSVRRELEKSSLGLNLSLVVLVLISFVPIIFVRRLSARKLPPAPPGWPLIGHLHLLGTHPHQSMAQLAAKYAPQGIMYLKFGLKGGVVVTTEEMAKEIFKKHDLAFSNRPHLIILDLLVTNKQGVAFGKNSASWRALRKIFVQEVLSPKRMQHAEQLRASETDYMMNSMYRECTQNPAAAIEINKKFWVLNVNFISRLVLSKRYFSDDPKEDDEMAAEFKYVMDEQFFLIGAIFPADSFPFLRPFDIGGLEKRTKIFFPRFQAILTKILTERREKRKQAGDSYVDQDLVDVLLTNEEKGEVTDGAIRGAVWDAFAGGTDTLITTVEWGMAHIVANPNIFQKLQAELDREVGVDRRVVASDLPPLNYLHAVVKELFRLHPPAPLLLPHETNEECTVAGYHIPANTRLFVNVWAIGRDPKIWDNPLDFSPERFLEPENATVDVQGHHYKLLPFGAGRRICPAMALGLGGVQLNIATLVQGFDWSLPPGTQAGDIDMTERSGLTIPMATPLKIVAKPRLAAHLYAV